MKKILKLSAILMLIAVICFTFGGCDAIDEARAIQAFRVDSDTIAYGEEKYLALPYCEYLDPISMNGDYVRVTEPDVPVLLSSTLGEMYYKSDDGLIISNWSAKTHYCRSDKYDEMVQLIDSGFENTGYCYSYYDYDEYVTKYYCLTESQNSAIIEVFFSGESSVISNIASPDYKYTIDLEIYSNNLNFRQDTVDLCVLGEDYYIVHVEEDSTSLYRVPDNLTDVFDEIVANFMKTENELTKEFSDEESFDEEIYY